MAVVLGVLSDEAQGDGVLEKVLKWGELQPEVQLALSYTILGRKVPLSYTLY